MKQLFRTPYALALAWLMSGAGCTDVKTERANTLTPAETTAGWRLLWDGRSPAGWRTIDSPDYPTNRWGMHDGVLSVRPNPRAEFESGHDLITTEKFSNFDFQWEFKLTPGANSGVKYFVRSNLDPATGQMIRADLTAAIGCEYQLLDDDRHPDAQAGREGNRKLGSLYDLIPAPATRPLNPVGEWNTARIVANGNHVEHWLNGVKLIEYDRNGPAFHELVARSKFREVAGFGDWRDGHLLLQDHGNEVFYRNLRVKVLP